MDANANDRRVKKTRKALREALAILMTEKELPSITIRELTDKADIHRATFYTHYTDIYDLYKQLEDAILDDLGEIIVHDQTHSYDEVIKGIIDYVDYNANTCRMFLNENGSRSFYDRFTAFLENKYTEIWQYETNNKEITEEWKLLVRYHLEGCIAILSQWAISNYTYPKDKLTEIILKADTNFDRLLYG